jgi:hypothetical protein
VGLNNAQVKKQQSFLENDLFVFVCVCVWGGGVVGPVWGVGRGRQRGGAKEGALKRGAPACLQITPIIDIDISDVVSQVFTYFVCVMVFPSR